MTRQLPSYLYHGARSMVLMHEQGIRDFLEVWREAEAKKLSLLETDDSDYESLTHLLRHVLSSARGYMVWLCRVLELPDPAIEDPPGNESLAAEAEDYIEHLLEHWATPLAVVEQNAFGTPEHKSNWGILYCADSMLEHAVMHPLRHAFQLRALLLALNS